MADKFEPEDLRIQKGFSRYYLHPSPENRGLHFKSVTSILDGLSKGGLFIWSAEQALNYAIDNIDDIKYASTLEPADKFDYIKRLRYKALNSKRATYRRDLGNLFHAKLDAYFKGFEYKLPAQFEDTIQNYLKQIIDFLKDNNIELWLSEAVCYNTKYEYAGTADYIGKYKDEYICIDFKTGKKIYPDSAAQVAGYIMCDQVLDDDGNVLEMPKITRGLILQPTDNGLNYIPIDVEESLYRWKAAIQIDESKYTWSNEEYNSPWR